MRGDREADCVQQQYGSRGRHSGRACDSVRRLEATSDVHASKGALEDGSVDQGGGNAALRGDAMATRSSIGGRCVLVDVLGGDVKVIA
jgi:hypothetical protein